MTEIRKRKLIEVALPLEAINRESAREKSIRHGHPSTLHLWWARRPLAACRAVLFAQLVDDPSSHPDRFPDEASQAAERKRLFDIIERLVVWENANDEALLKEARAEISASCRGNPPPILDPFAGGGSIPLEAQRLGLEAHASDLNPVAVLINKALIEIPPKWANQPPVFPGAAEERAFWPGATGLAEDVRRYGQWIRDEAEKRIGHLYPKAKLPDGSEATVIAWLWARTVTCPNPACGINMPLVRSWWLGKKRGKEAYVVPSVVDDRVVFDIGHDPAHAPTKDKDGTVSRTGAICIGCGDAVPLAYIRAEGKAGRIGQQLMAIVAEGDRQRIYLPPNDEHAAAADVPRPVDVPDTQIPYNPRYLTAPNYGMTKHVDLFTNRQLTALSTLTDLVVAARGRIADDAKAATDFPGREPLAYADAVTTFLAIGVSKVADIGNALCSWKPSMNQAIHLFTRQAIPMVWDFAETPPLGTSAGGFTTSLGGIIRVISELPSTTAGSVKQADASSRPYYGVVATDPPYYDNVGYADLSDFFYIWLRKSLGAIYPDLFATVLSPKSDELVADPFRKGGNENAERFFEEGFRRVFTRIRESCEKDFPITLFYAFKQSESRDQEEISTGWETFLEGMMQAGWTVTATWPMRTELGNRMRNIESNALASSILLACRPRTESARTMDRRGLISALRSELPTALKELQQSSIAPVDLAQAAIGPGMAVFSRYAYVAEPDGSPMTVRTALNLINQVLAEVLTEQEADLDADSRFALKWFEQHGWDKGKFGDAETLAKAMNTAVDGLERAGIFRARAGEARLVQPEELPDDYNPANDERLSVWEIVLHLVKQMETNGIDAAGQLLGKARTRIDTDAVKKLAYLLHSICERRKWAQQALRFNNLVTAWLDLDHVARGEAIRTGVRYTQDELPADHEDGE